MDKNTLKQIGESTAPKTATILQFPRRARPQPRQPTLLDVLERQLFDDADP